MEHTIANRSIGVDVFVCDIHSMGTFRYGCCVVNMSKFPRLPLYSSSLSLELRSVTMYVCVDIVCMSVPWFNELPITHRHIFNCTQRSVHTKQHVVFPVRAFVCMRECDVYYTYHINDYRISAVLIWPPNCTFSLPQTNSSHVWTQPYTLHLKVQKISRKISFMSERNIQFTVLICFFFIHW